MLESEAIKEDESSENDVTDMFKLASKLLDSLSFILLSELI